MRAASAATGTIGSATRSSTTIQQSLNDGLAGQDAQTLERNCELPSQEAFGEALAEDAARHLPLHLDVNLCPVGNRLERKARGQARAADRSRCERARRLVLNHLGLALEWLPQQSTAEDGPRA